MAKFTKITDPAQLNEALDVYEKAWERIPMPPCDASDYTQPNCSGLKIRCRSNGWNRDGYEWQQSRLLASENRTLIVNGSEREFGCAPCRIR
jgi:hypothetical protein